MRLPLAAAAGTGLPWLALACLGGGCSANAAPSRVAWDACSFLAPDAVVGAVDAGTPDAGTFRRRGATDFAWPGPGPDAAWALETAGSRCEYTVDAAGGTVDVVLAARLSGSDDRTVAGIRALLSSEGYPAAATVPPTVFTATAACVTDALWASISYGGTDGGAGTQRRGELHVLLSTPPAAKTGCAAEAGDDRKESLYGYLVLFVTAGANLDAAGERTIATALMNGVLPKARSAMKGIAREQREALDAGPAEGPEAGTDAPPPPDAATSLPLADYPGAAAAALCARLDECCSADERAAGNIPGGSTATCTAFVTAAFDLALAGTGQSIDEGALAYDPAVAAACLDQYRATPCAVLQQGSAAAIPCLDAFTPRIAGGGTCHSDLDCTGGYCRIDPGDAGAVSGGPPIPSGVCTAPAPFGAACDVDPACESGSCQNATCVSPLPRPWCQGI